MSEKRFLSAVVLLVRSVKTINKPEMLEIGALSDLRTYLQTQETAILEILIEELHNHLYLKSYYSESRWRSYTRGQTKREPYISALHHPCAEVDCCHSATNRI